MFLTILSSTILASITLYALLAKPIPAEEEDIEIEESLCNQCPPFEDIFPFTLAPSIGCEA